MSMDAAWKVYVGDRRFDDNQISNLFLKLKYETVGRFTFDFRPIDGDESYMVVGNTLRIFWGDLHRLDGVIQRVDWDDTQYCYHVFGADIRGFLLDRVNTEPATVNSYTSDVQSYVQYEGCDFPSNIWTGAGDQIGKYTFHYKIGIQNTIRITGATQNRWYTVVERGTVYDHVNGCLYDATKNWAANEHKGRILRFVSGACKNNVYNIIGNSSTRVCLGRRSATCDYYTVSGTQWVHETVENGGFETGDLTGWTPHIMGTSVATIEVVANPADIGGTYCVRLFSTSSSWDPYRNTRIYAPIPSSKDGDTLTFSYYFDGISYPDNPNIVGGFDVVTFNTLSDYNSQTNQFTVSIPKVPATGWTTVSRKLNLTTPATNIEFLLRAYGAGLGVSLLIDNISVGTATTSNPCGVLPGCSRPGDIYEIVFASMERIEPASLAPATLEKDNHIIQYNQTDDLSDRTTVVTVMGAD